MPFHHENTHLEKKDLGHRNYPHSVNVIYIYTFCENKKLKHGLIMNEQLTRLLHKESTELLNQIILKFFSNLIASVNYC